MAIQNPTFTVAFDKTEGEFSLADGTDYDGDGIELEDVRGCFTNVEDPLENVLHANTDFDDADILPDSSLLYTGISLPTDTNGDVLEGDYSFTYGIKVDAPITAVNTGAKTFTIVGDYAALITSSGTITVVRSTGNNDDYTVVTAVYGGANTVITVSEVVPSAVADGSIQYEDQAIYSTTRTVTYSDEIATVDIDVEVDCFSGTFTSTDATSYGATATLISRTHTIKYPAALEKADVVSTSIASAVIVVTPIYTKTWTSIVTSVVEYDLGDGDTISATITGSQDTVVSCDLSLCEISCGVIALENRYTAAQTANPVRAKEYYDQLTRVFQLVSEFEMQSKCSQNDLAAATLAKIRVAGEFTADCGCDDSDEPVQIVPIGGSGTTSVVSAGTGISVSSSGSSTVTYQVSLSQSYLDIIAALAPVNVVAGDAYIDVVESTVGGVQTFTVTNEAPFIPLNTQQSQCLISYSNFAAPTVALTLVSSTNVKEGSNMVEMNVASAGSVGVGLWKFQNNYFTVSGFQTSSNTTFKPFVSIVQLETQTLAGVATTQANQYLRPADIDVRILNIGSETFDFQFVEKSSGIPLSNYALVYTYKIMVNIEIKQ